MPGSRLNQQVAELFVYILHVSHCFPRGRYTTSFLASTGNIFLSKWEILASSMNTGSKLWAERFS